MMVTTAANTYVEVSPLMVTHVAHMGPDAAGERCALYLSNREHPIFLNENAAKVMERIVQEQVQSTVDASNHTMTLMEDLGRVTAIYRWRCSCGAESQYDAARPAYAQWEFKAHVVAVAQ